MKTVIQRVSEASVFIDNRVEGIIQHGFMILLGIETNDNKEDVEWLIKKIINLRIFNDPAGKMNLSIKDVNGSILVISQFTLLASTKKGNRPSFIHAARPEQAIPLYKSFTEELRKASIHVATGVFGADMKVALVNDGPVTILLDSKNKV